MARKGEQIGPYTLIEKLGRGSFGVVWLAEKRTALTATKVALKLPNDDDIDLDAIRREADLWVAVSGHPNVLPIIEADIYDDQVVIVSEYAPDGSLAQWIKHNGGKAPSAKIAVEMIDGVLSGLEHLHSKQIIHRDLKPANILLQGRTPRLVDFGLARLMKTTSHSKTVSGTYAYMPPEAFEGSRSKQTDLWSAGVILYEMLTGELPFPTVSDATVVAAILTKDPAPLPDTFQLSLRTVIARAMRKDLSERYQTAAQMRAALREVALALYAEDEKRVAQVNSQTNVSSFSAFDKESIETQEPAFDSESTIERVGNLSVPTVTAKPSEFYVQELKSQDVTELLPSVETIESRLASAGEKTIQEPGKTEASPTAHYMDVASPQTQASPTVNAELLSTLKQERDLQTPSHPLKGKSDATVPNVTGSYDTVRTATPEKEKLIGLKQTEASPTQISPELKLPAAQNKQAQNSDPTLVVPYKAPFEASKNNEEKSRKGLWVGVGLGAGALALAILAVITFVVLRNFVFVAEEKKDAPKNAPTENKPPQVVSETVSGRPIGTLMTESNVYEVAISSDGKLAASVGDDSNVRLWRVTESNLPIALSGHGKTVRTVAISPDGQTVASGSDDKSVRLWRTSDGELVRELTGHNEWVFRIAFSPDGKTIASASGDKTIRLWNAANGNMNNKLDVPDATELIVNLSPDLKLVAFYHPQTKNVRVWSVTDNKLISELQGDKFEVHGGAFAYDNQTFALGSKDGVIRIYKVSDGKLISSLRGKQGETGSVVYNHNGQIIAAGYEDGQICVWRVSDGQMLKTLKGHTKFIYALAFSSDNRVLASGGEDKTLRLWEIAGK